METAADWAVAKPTQFLLANPMSSAAYLASCIALGNISVFLGGLSLGLPVLPSAVHKAATAVSAVFWWLTLPEVGSVWAAGFCLLKLDLGCARDQLKKVAGMTAQAQGQFYQSSCKGFFGKTKCMSSSDLMSYCAGRQQKGDLGTGSTRKACDKAFNKLDFSHLDADKAERDRELKGIYDGPAGQPASTCSLF